MQKKRAKCIVGDCAEPAFAKGYCRRHYGQVWRRKKTSRSGGHPDLGLEMSADELKRLQNLERELKQAEHMYHVVVGCEGRIKWRREIEAVKAEIRKIEEANGLSASARASRAQN